jgi:hypothetical protein
MSDTDRDVVLNAGTGGANIASEYSKYGGVTAHFQMVKPVHGASGTINAVSDAAPWPSVLRGGGSNNKLTTTLLTGSNDTFDVNLRGQSGANNIATNMTQFAGLEIGTAHGLPITNVGSTGSTFLAVSGNTYGGPITITGGTGGLNIRGLTFATDSVRVHGTTGATPVGVSLGGPIFVQYVAGKGLSAGAPGATSEYPSSVAIQGISGAFLVGITAGSSADTGLFIRGLTHSVDSVAIHGYDGAVAVGVTAGAGGFNIRGLTHDTDGVQVYSIPGSTLDIRNLVPTRDVVGVTGSGLYGTIGTMIVGRTGENVGVSGDALKVSLVDATINATINVGTDIEVKNDVGNPLFVSGTTGAFGDTRVWVGTTGNIGITVAASNFDIRNLESQLDSVRIVGTTGSYNIGITAGSQFGGQPGLNVRRLDGGTAGFTGSLNDGTPNTGYINIDTVAIQGICGGLAVGITAGGVVANGLTIRPLTTTSDAIRVHGSTGSYDIGITAGSQFYGQPGLNVRRLYGGTAGFTGSLNDGTPDTGYINIDTVAVQGICGAYPVGVTTGSNPLMVTSSLAYPITVTGGGSGGSMNVNLFSGVGTPLGNSGDALKVSIADAVINATVTVASAVEINNDDGNPIPIAGGNTAAVRIEGSTGSNVVPISIVGATTWGPPLRIAGVTHGTVVGISGDVNVRDITGTVSLPTGAATNATLSELANTIGSTLGLLGVTLDIILEKLPGGAAQQDSTQAQYMLPNNQQLIDLNSDTNAIMGSASTAASNTGTIAGAVDSAKMKVKIAVGDIAVPTSFVTGSKDVNASSVQITTNPTTLNNGINIKGHPRNEDHIWVTQDDTANNGYPLGAGEELFLDINDLNKVYVYADQTGLTACYIYR